MRTSTTAAKKRTVRWVGRLLVPAFLLALVQLPGACSPRMAQFMAGAVIVGAAVAVVAHHDAHYHHRHCGHHYVVVEDREVYEYEGRWEYYDESTGEWYYYEEPPVPTYHRHYHYYDNGYGY